MPEEAEEWFSDDQVCHFCVIASTAKPTPHPTIAASPSASAYLVLSTHAVVGFLELAPMSRGHIVLLPREHAGKISDLSSDASAVLGYWLPIVSRGVMAGLFGTKWQANDESWNILQANGEPPPHPRPLVEFSC